MGYTHFLTKTEPRVSTEMAPHIFAYNLTKVLKKYWYQGCRR
jgi:transposase